MQCILTADVELVQIRLHMLVQYKEERNYPLWLCVCMHIHKEAHTLECAAICCGASRSIACCSVLQCVAVCCSVSCVCAYTRIRAHTRVCCSVLWCVAVCCGALWCVCACVCVCKCVCVFVCAYVCVCVCVWERERERERESGRGRERERERDRVTCLWHSNSLWNSAAHCNMQLQHATATHCNMQLQNIATCNTSLPASATQTHSWNSFKGCCCNKHSQKI